MSNSYVPPRGPDGKIIVEPTGFSALLDQSMQDVEATPAPVPSEEPTPPSRPAVQIAGVAAGLLVTIMLIAAIRAFSPVAPAPPAADVPTAPASVRTSETAQPTPPAAAAMLPRAVIAYAAPGGDLIGPIEPGRAYTLTATFGADWLQLDTAGSGPVWVQASALPGVADQRLPDLQPPTPLPTSTPVPAPVIVYRPAPPPPPAPTVCADAQGGGVYVQRCGYDLAALRAEAEQAAWDQLNKKRGP